MSTLISTMPAPPSLSITINTAEMFRLIEAARLALIHSGNQPYAIILNSILLQPLDIPANKPSLPSASVTIIENPPASIEICDRSNCTDANTNRLGYLKSLFQWLSITEYNELCSFHNVPN